MYCVNCGSFLKQEDHFCGRCGARAAERQRPTRPPQRQDVTTQSRVTRNIPSPTDSHTSGMSRASQLSTLPNIPHQVLLAIGLAQVVGVVIFLIRYWTDLSPYDGALEVFAKAAFPFALADLVLVAPIVLAGISPRNASNPVLLAAASVSGLIQFTRAVPSLLLRGVNFSFYNIGPTSSATTFLPTSLIAAAAVFVVPLAALRLKPGPWMIGIQSDWWRALLGLVAVVLLMVEYPGRVLSDTWPILGFVVLAAMTGSGYLERRVSLGAFLGLSVAIAGSVIAYAGYWIILGSDRYGFSIVSIPSVLALALSMIGVVSIWKQDPGSLRQLPTVR